MTDYLKIRKGVCYFHRRTPAYMKKFDSRPHVRVSLKTRDRVEGKRKAAALNDVLEAYWDDLVATKKVHGQDEAWNDAVTMARAHGFRYRAAAEFGPKDAPEVLKRLETVEKQSYSKLAVKGLLGTAIKPKMPLSASIDVYFEATAEKLAGKSENYIKKWKNPRVRAVNNFDEAVKEALDVDQIERRHILALRAWWVKRIVDENMNADTARKDFVHLKDVLRVLAREADIDLNINSLFSDIQLKGAKSSRQPFDADFVQNKILGTGKLKTLNDEARAIIYIISDSGARVNEVVGLLPDDIILDEEIPYIWIRPNEKRTLKNDASERKIPLVGAALYGAKMMPRGFLRYKTADSASALINKYMKKHKMIPTKEHTLYSLRHTFKDRLRDIGAPDEIMDELMGHTTNKPKYGRGHKLENKLEWLQKIAFKI